MQRSDRTFQLHDNDLDNGIDNGPDNGLDNDLDLDSERAIRQLRRPAYGPWVLLLLVVCGAGYGLHRGLKERQRLLGEVQRASQNGRALAELQARQDKLNAEKAALAAERTSLQQALAAKDNALAAKDTALAALKDTQDKLQDKMKAEIAKGEIALSQTGGRLRVDMVDKILFDSGDAHISRRGEEVLGRVGAVLVNVPDRQIQVLGHTDNQPITGRLKDQFPTNWELSSSRALNVVRFLQETANVPGDRLMATGHGEHQPIASNKSAAGRARNRRIEILLTPLLEPARVSKDELGARAALQTHGRAPAPAAPRR